MKEIIDFLDKNRTASIMAMSDIFYDEIAKIIVNLF